MRDDVLQAERIEGGLVVEMSGLDMFAVFVLLILLLAIVAIWVVLAMLPGKIARQRNHPQADAINVGGWLGALLLGVLWPLVLVWAYTKPQGAAATIDGVSGESATALRARLERLEAKLAVGQE